ncbi:unnamed protein product [Owenia fusiformis]|uniref:Leucine carboxyl methyltransferase 1 n=1 Tax=Owenia fusiformis TaxID=6347 RepID=A0A8J1XRP6_OWEFU|nr:unnamed protein product [Owenia fusiformis]
MASDDAIRATNDEASMCKRFAVQQGYWNDPYIKYFIRSSDRKPPDINRGYFARVKGVHCLLNQFLQATKCKCQVVSLGAGYDTTYWNLQESNMQPERYIEMDFENVTSHKCHFIKSRKPLLEKIATKDGEIRFSKTDLHADNYHIVAVDLRNLIEVETKLKESGFDNDIPTIFIAECVLVYMESEKSNAIIKWIADNVKTAYFVNYEQVNMGDRFGHVMLDNLRSRQCGLPGTDVCQTIDTQQNRFTSQGWTSAEAWDMNTVYSNLPQKEIQRIEKLEFLDERESFEQLLHHYCLCWAYIDGAGVGLENISVVNAT